MAVTGISGSVRTCDTFCVCHSEHRVAGDSQKNLRAQAQKVGGKGNKSSAERRKKKLDGGVVGN